VCTCGVMLQAEVIRSSGAVERTEMLQKNRGFVPPPPEGKPTFKKSPPPPKQMLSHLKAVGPQPPSNVAIKLPESKLPEPKNEEAPFKCEKCGFKFKKVAHLIVHSRTHKDRKQDKNNEEDQRDSEESEWDDEDEDEDEDAIEWIDDFTKSLTEIAQAESVALKAASTSNPMEKPISRAATISNHLTKARRGEKIALAPPPGYPPPGVRKVECSKTTIGIEVAEGKFCDEDFQALETLRRRIAEMDRKGNETIRARLSTRKDVEIQEIEFKLAKVQQEMARVKKEESFIVENKASFIAGSGRTFRKAEYLMRLGQAEHEIQQELENERRKIRAEEESHPEYGLDAQNLRRFEMHKLQTKVASELKEGEEATANEIGKRALNFHIVQRRFKEAEQLYQKALEVDEDHATNLGNFALFLHHCGCSEVGFAAPDTKLNKSQQLYCDGKADKLFRRAIQLNASCATNLLNFATFLKTQGDFDRAEQYFERAADAAPLNASILGNFATFLCEVRKDFKAGLAKFKRSFELEPGNVNNCCNFAKVLEIHFQDFSSAHDVFEKASFVSNHPNISIGFANLLSKHFATTANLFKAKNLLSRALQDDPDNPNIKHTLMTLLRDFPQLRDPRHERKLPRS